MINQQFFNYVALLEDKYAKQPQYNLFNVLRSQSDEVRLHSRFLADLFNPKGAHQYKSTFVDLLLTKLGVELSGPLSVDLEYKNIDILIRSKECAVVIENKIYAEDQPEQLARYHQSMKDEGYTDIRLVYLTLDGKMPSDNSTVGLSKEDLDDEHFKLLSYENDIYPLISRCIEITATDAPLREALIQYKSIIAALTSKIENKEHMDALKKLLKSDNNIASMPSLFDAYQEVLIELQLDIWQKIGNGIRAEFGELDKGSIVEQSKQDQYSSVKSYVENRRGSRFSNIIVKLNSYDDIYLIVEQDHHVYFGIYCESKEASNDYKAFMKKTRDIPHTLPWGDNGIYAYAQPEINFKYFTPEHLSYLSLEENRKQYADSIVKKLKEFVEALNGQ